MQEEFQRGRLPKLLRPFLPDIDDIDSEWRQTEHPAPHVAHYTDVQGALGILETQELWFRRVEKMESSTVAKDDECEIRFGIDSFMSNWNERSGDAIKNEIESIDPSSVKEVAMEIERNRSNVELETYIFCTCIHNNEGDSALPDFWKRSDIALVFNRPKLQLVAGDFGALTGLVQYKNKEEYSDYFARWLNVLREYGEKFGSREKGYLGKTIGWAAMYMAMLTKRPEYAGEKEWRVFYRFAGKGKPPEFQMQPKDVRIKGVYETIYSMKINITNNLLEKILVIPGINSQRTINLVKMELKQRGISGVEVVLADIRIVDALKQIDFGTVQKFAVLVALKLLGRVKNMIGYAARL